MIAVVGLFIAAPSSYLSRFNAVTYLDMLVNDIWIIEMLSFGA
jgi:hypothetical protein